MGRRNKGSKAEIAIFIFSGGLRKDILNKLGGWYGKVREALEAKWRPDLSDGSFSVSTSEDRIYLILPDCLHIFGLDCALSEPSVIRIDCR